MSSMNGIRSALAVLGGLFASHQAFQLLAFIHLYSSSGSLGRYKTDEKKEAPAWALVYDVDTSAHAKASSNFLV